MMMIHTFLTRRNHDYMDPPRKGAAGRRYELSLERGNRLIIRTSLERGSDDETVIENGMAVMFQSKRGQALL